MDLMHLKSLALTFAGHFSRSQRREASFLVKCYVFVFICFATKAVHLELIMDPSTVSFLHGLKRFICTRRRPRQICSYDATNFVGARNELLELRRLFLSSDHQRARLDFCLVSFLLGRHTLAVFGKRL